MDTEIYLVRHGKPNGMPKAVVRGAWTPLSHRTGVSRRAERKPSADGLPKEDTSPLPDWKGR